MAIARNLETIFDQARLNKYSNFIVKDHNSRLLLLDSAEDRLDTHIEHLKKFLENISGRVTIKVYQLSVTKKGGGSPKNYFEYEYDCNPGSLAVGSPINQQPIQTASGPSEEDIKKRLQAEFELKQEILDLKRDIADKDRVNPYLEKAIGYIPQFLALLSGQTQPVQTVGVAGSENDSTDLDNDKLRINQAVIKLIKLDPNFADNIERLAELAQNNPQVYQMAIQQLNNLNNGE